MNPWQGIEDPTRAVRVIDWDNLRWLLSSWFAMKRRICLREGCYTDPAERALWNRDIGGKPDGCCCRCGAAPYREGQRNTYNGMDWVKC
jgi:hypothetical protein